MVGETIGYEIGEWLRYIIVFVIGVIVARYFYNKRKKKKAQSDSK